MAKADVASKGKEVWLCRDDSEAGDYMISDERPSVEDGYWENPGLRGEIVSGETVHWLIGCEPLKRGGGPIRVRLSMEVVDE